MKNQLTLDQLDENEAKLRQALIKHLAKLINEQIHFFRIIKDKS